MKTLDNCRKYPDHLCTCYNQRNAWQPCIALGVLMLLIWKTGIANVILYHAILLWHIFMQSVTH